MATAVQSATMPPSPNSNKRKRGVGDHDNGRSVKSQNTSVQDNSSGEPNYAALLQGMQSEMPGHDSNAQTAQAALASSMPHSSYPDSFDTSSQLASYDDATSNGAGMSNSPTAQALYDARMQTQKPAVGSTAWHQQRKDNHKEGKIHLSHHLLPCVSSDNELQSNVAVVKLSTKALKISPRLFQEPKRTKAPYCNAHVPISKNYRTRLRPSMQSERHSTTPCRKSPAATTA